MTVGKQGLSLLWDEYSLKVVTAGPLALRVTGMTSFISLPSVAFVHEEILPPCTPRSGMHWDCAVEVLSSPLRLCHIEAVGDSWCNLVAALSVRSV